ncbi:MAG: ABC transporter substrate-binding protein, partial [Anaerolineae bacterium]|nr:ABC transporter substrate-binding protein [Anaerolineae bacterium]
MKRRMWILYGALFACGLLLQSCNKAETTQIPAENQEPIKLKVAVFRFLSYGPFFIAQDEGFFAEQGLDVEFVHFEKTADSIPALARGDLDVATGILTVNLLNAIASGENIRFTASRGYMEVSDCPYGALMAQSSLLEDGSLVDPVQLKDMRIAMDVPSIYQYLLDQHLAQASLDSGDVNAQTISFPTMSESFANDAIDLGFTFEPWVTRIKKSGNGDVYIPLADIEPGFPVGFILYGNNLLNNTEAGRRFMVAYLKAVAQYNEGKT